MSSAHVNTDENFEVHTYMMATLTSKKVPIVCTHTETTDM